MLSLKSDAWAIQRDVPKQGTNKFGTVNSTTTTKKGFVEFAQGVTCGRINLSEKESPARI